MLHKKDDNVVMYVCTVGDPNRRSSNARSVDIAASHSERDEPEQATRNAQPAKPTQAGQPKIDIETFAGSGAGDLRETRRCDTAIEAWDCKIRERTRRDGVRETLITCKRR